MPNIKHQLTINVPASKVYKAVTETAGLKGWWTDGASAKPELGSIAVFDFGNRYHNEMRIKELDPDKKVSWLCEKGDKEWVGTGMVFSLDERNGKTVLTFEHKDWKEATDFFASCNYNWGWYLTSLKDYCEKGEGRPFSQSTE